MLIELTKLGRNCQVVFYNTDNGNTQTFQEDSANVECTYNVLSDVVSVAVKGRTQATTTSIVDNDVLYINTGSGDILIKTYADYLINYALLFLNSGGGSGGLLTADNGLTANSSTNVQLGGTLIADTSINAASNIFELINGTTIGINGNTINLYSNNTNGITNNNSRVIIGDFNDNNNLTTFFVDDQNKRIYSKLEGINKGISLDVVGANDLFSLGKNAPEGEFQGLFLDYGNNTLQFGLLGSPDRPHLQINNSSLDLALTTGASGFNAWNSLGLTNIGDVNSYGNGTNIQIFDQSVKIQTICFGVANGFYMQFDVGNYYFGDYVSYITASYLHIDAGGGTSTLFSNIITLSGGGGCGFFMDLALSQTTIGDYANVGNNSFLKVDDSEGKISLNTANGLVNIANIQVYTDNADALANGLVVGDLYRHKAGGESEDQLRIVH